MWCSITSDRDFFLDSLVPRGDAHSPFAAPLYLKGLRPLPPTPPDSRIFGFFDLSKNVDVGDFPVGFTVWEGLQSIRNGCGLQMDGF